jgi:phosphocarrier protein
MQCSSRQIVEISNQLGLYLRAADRFVRIAQKFKSEIRVSCNGRDANGKSILDLGHLRTKTHSA